MTAEIRRLFAAGSLIRDPQGSPEPTAPGRFLAWTPGSLHRTYVASWVFFLLDLGRGEALPSREIRPGRIGAAREHSIEMGYPGQEITWNVPRA